MPLAFTIAENHTGGPTIMSADNTTTRADGSTFELLWDLTIPVATIFLIAFAMYWVLANRHEENVATYQAERTSYQVDADADLLKIDALLTSDAQKEIFEGYRSCMDSKYPTGRSLSKDKNFVCAPAAEQRVTQVEPQNAASFRAALAFYEKQYSETLSKHPNLLMSYFKAYPR